MPSSIQNTSTTAQDKSFFDQQIANFKQKAAQFQQAYNALMSSQAQAARDPRLKAEWQALANRGFSIRDKIQYITSKVDAAVNWFKSSFGDYDLTEDAQELGFLPVVALIPIAAIAGVIAVINNYVSDVYLFNKKIAAAEGLISKGVAPEDVAQIIKGSTPPPAAGIFGGMTNTLKWVAIGGAVLLIWQMTRK